MEKLGCSLILSFLFFPLAASALSVRYLGETSLEHKMKFRDTKVGGLSGLAYHEGRLWAISDDKGRDGDPRFYVFKLKINGTKVSLTGDEVSAVHGFKEKKGEVPYLDMEAIVRLPSGDLLISSENNNDRKPREMPRIFRVDGEGKFKNDLSLPAKFLPESLGQQKKGLQNNAAFEGLTLTPDGRALYAVAEAPVVTDMSDEAVGDKSTQWVRMVKFESKAGAEFSPTAEYAYRIDDFSQTAKGMEIFRGVSEVLAVSEKKFLILERGVRLQKTSWNQSVSLYEADLTSADDVSAIGNLSGGKFKAMTKKKILDFETGLEKERPRKSVQNFEGLAWGPTLPDGKKTLLVISDDNFSKKEKTELLVLTVEGE